MNNSSGSPRAEERAYPRVREIFGSLVFGRRAMKEHLPRNVHENLEDAMAGRRQLDPGNAEIVAMAMKEWAISNGATHWAHWFHPMTEITAEKHMAFTVPMEDGAPLETFRGKDLMQGEPDASSFPSAGQRSTFEARGYSAWDTSSPAFIVKSAKGGTLCIPSVFLSYDGTPLDLKTGLLRALDSIESQSMKLLRLFGQRGIRYVRVTIGGEQEFFLLDRPRAQLRPDIRFCGRTVIGAQPAKDQKQDHHYFGAIPQRVLAYMEDVERDLARLGIAIATRHNEVARCQFEFAPLFAEANLACDQNQIIMETMRKLARKHELRLLFHEKPFDDMNGSGKHVNISMVDSEGRNLLKASANHRKNVVFLTFLASFVYGVARHFPLLQVTTATPGNLYRLGGHEAPPAILSVYLGEALTRMIKEIQEMGGTGAEFVRKPAMDLGLAKLAAIKAHDSDRNRTSPVAFTGDKFEFRAPGASQALSWPVTALTAVWSWGIKRVTERIESLVADGRDPLDAAVETVGWAGGESANVLFEGDAYTGEWAAEAESRGLVRSQSIPETIDMLLENDTVEMLEELGIYSRRELAAIHEIRMEAFCTAIEVEMAVLYDMLFEGVLPAISKQMILEKTSIDAVGGDFPEGAPWRSMIRRFAVAKATLLDDASRLAKIKADMGALTARERADVIVNEAVPLMAKIRATCDEIELMTASDIWPYPIYRNLLSLSM